ncbi:MAG TPA: betaine/proline/choline family ABC transporter ATP-binding protein, partial [Kiloniellales bacterium]|nr:betaine/proline/choline family ABC transporter ATP-binding protein [Kiloniellales bacterium]
RAGASREEIQRELGHVVAVDDVSFSVAPEETFAVMGLSGSGKSTLLRCINRLITPTAGQVQIDGEDVTEADEERLRHIRLRKLGMVFQHFALFPHRSVAENVEYGLKVRGLDADERRKKALEWLDAVGLADWADRPPEDLSGGMKQRVGLARALAVEPEILMMDEPFSALDPLIRRDMQDELITLQRRFRKSIIFITHDLHEALRLGNRIAIMKQGRFVQIGTPEEIVDRPADSYVAAFTQDVDRSRVVTAGAIMRRLDDSARKELGADAPSVSEDAHLIDVFPLCRDDQPIAVIDHRDRPVGMIRPIDLIARMLPPEAVRTARERPEESVEPALQKEA